MIVTASFILAIPIAVFVVSIWLADVINTRNVKRESRAHPMDI